MDNFIIEARPPREVWSTWFNRMKNPQDMTVGELTAVARTIHTTINDLIGERNEAIQSKTV